MTDDNCCSQDCNQGRDCPHKHSAISIADVAFTVVMGTITLVAAVSICWWLITAVVMLVEVLK
jgi:hypothetical protein